MSQAMDALEHGNMLRLERAAVRRKVRRLRMADGNREVATILVSPGELWSGAKLGYVLQMARHVGPVAVEKTCRRFRVDSDSRLEDIPARVRMGIAILASPETVAEMTVTV